MNMRPVLLTVLAVLAGCMGTGGSPSNGLSQDLAATRAEYLILDLATGQAVPSGTASASDPSHLVFRRVPTGSTVLGAPAGEVARQSDEGQYSETVAAYYIAITECTQAQWQSLAGSTPWLGSGLPVGAAMPAYNLSHSEALAGVISGNARMRAGQLALPTAAEWERACRGGSASAFSWGDATGQAGVAASAVVAETRTSDGPQPCGGRAANAFGLYDMHGNVWEYTADGDLRGGSWLDPVTLARAANRQVVEPDTALPIAGLRLCWRPRAP